MVTFQVDDVPPAAAKLETQPLAGLFPDALAVGPGPEVVAPDGVHPLLSAVGRAFAEHRPLVLSPDAVWLTILQGVAQHIKLNAEDLRPLLVNHSGRKRLEVSLTGPMPGDEASWLDIADSFSKLVAAEVATADLFECDFSTSTEVERMAGRIILLDAYSPYFALWLTCVCGIPSITLTGTVDDWRKIRARVDELSVFGLQQWQRSLKPIADQFVRAASGDADTEFWQRIYNPVDAYGGEVITGWVTRFYPYLQGTAALDFPNPMLELRVGEPRDVPAADGFYSGPGIGSSRVPATLSKVLVNVNDQVAGENRVVALQAGLVGVAQDEDGALRPVAGWALTEAGIEMDDVLDRIERDHQVMPPGDLLGDGPADLIALYRRFGSATLFDGAWRLLPNQERRRVGWVDVVFDLADGRSIGYMGSGEDVEWVTIREGDDEPMLPVYGTSLAMLLNTALESNGEFEHLRTRQRPQLFF